MHMSANRARLNLRVAGIALPVLSLEGEEALSSPFRFIVEVLIEPGLSLGDYMGASGQLSISGKGGCRREIAGVLTWFEEQGTHSDGRRRAALRLESRLALLKHQSDSRMILGQSVVDMVRALLQRHGFSADQLRFELTRSYPLRPFTLQVAESDLAFLQRVLSAAGIFYWSSCEDDREVLHFSDHNSHCPYLQGQVVPFVPPGGLEPAPPSAAGQGSIHHLQVRQSMVASDFKSHDLCEEHPAVALLGEARSPSQVTAAGYRCEQVEFGAGAKSLDEAGEIARFRAERAAVDSCQMMAQGDVVALAPGLVFSLDASRLDINCSGDYLVTGLSHKASQQAGQGATGEDSSYSNHAQLIRRETPFRPKAPRRLQIPTTFTARIESDGGYAKLDEQGRYRLRALFDRDPKAHTEASTSIRRLSPYGGPPGVQPSGLHLPLLDGAEVLLSCLNGDPDRPMIVGTLPNPQQASPVTSANAAQNRLKTAADNELCLDDEIDAEAITLRTFAGHNILQLDAAALGHKIRLASKQGAMQWQAKKTMRLKSGDTLSERTGGDRLQNVENGHLTRTNSGEIHHQAATDIRQSAAKNIRLHAGGNIESVSGKHLRIDVAQGKQITVKGQQAGFTVQDGNLHIQAAKDMRITGQGGGDISLGQAGGGLVVKADGTVQLYGNKLSLEGGGGVGLNGAVNYQNGSGAAMPKAQAAAPLVAQQMEALVDENAPAIFNLAWSQRRVPVGQEVQAMFSVKNFRGGETATVTIYETDGNGQKDVVDQLSCQLDDGCGPHALSWSRSEDDANNDLEQELEEDCEGEELRPLEYVFEVDVNGQQSEESSGVLWLTQDVVVQVQHNDGSSVPDQTEVVLKSADGKKHYAGTLQGEAVFHDIVIGPQRILLLSYEH